MTSKTMHDLRPDTISYMIHHVFLPPQLPYGDDSDPDHERALVNITIHTLQQFKEVITEDSKCITDSVIRIVASVNDILDTEGKINQSKLFNALSSLPDPSSTILLHVRAQNAGIMISQIDHLIHLEVFELCPFNQSVVITKGRLRRSFPGAVVALSVDIFENPNFKTTIALTLARMSHQPAVGTQPKSKKAGKMHDEIRDTSKNDYRAVHRVSNVYRRACERAPLAMAKVSSVDAAPCRHAPKFLPVGRLEGYISRSLQDLHGFLDR